ncbi:MAG TPA: hypothetical protein V6D17_15285 [Candidatus Obscuribacterales bacterium]
MCPPAFDNLFSKVKAATKEAADKTAQAAKAAKIRVNIKTLEMEKNRHLQTIGLRTYLLYNENKSIDGNTLYDRIKEELNQIEHNEERIKELETEIQELQSQGHVDVSDVTDTEKAE